MTKRHTASLTQPSVQNHFPRTRPSRTRTRSLSRCIKTIATLATLGTLGTLAAVPRVALAESSVTLYGRLDNGIEYIHGIASGTNASADRWRGQSGDWGTSMLGLKGIEDLGAGQVVLFHLEQGLNTANGTVGGDGGFNRWASVGLQNKTFGTLSAGRMLWISNGIWDFDPFVQGGLVVRLIGARSQLAANQQQYSL
jgi:predicted porin